MAARFLGAGALVVFGVALWAPATHAACQRAPECSCCEYVRPVKRRLSRRELVSIPPGGILPGQAERQQSLGVNSAFFKLKNACAAWVQRNKGYSNYACHISDATQAQYRAYVYAANTPLNLKKETAAACRSGPVGGGLPMRTNVIYTCMPDPSSPPPPPPSPPAPPPNRTGFLRLHAIGSASRHHPTPPPRVTRPEDGGSVLTGTFLTVLTVAGVLLCFAGAATFILLGGTESDFFQALREAFWPPPGPRSGDRRHGDLASEDDDDEYSYAAQHTDVSETDLPKHAPKPEEVYGARYAQPTAPAVQHTGPAATALI